MKSRGQIVNSEERMTFVKKHGWCWFTAESWTAFDESQHVVGQKKENWKLRSTPDGKGKYYRVKLLFQSYIYMYITYVQTILP